MNARRWISLGLVLASLTASAGAAPPLDDFLRDGRYRDGLAAFAAPADNAERFSLAVLQALDGFQRFSAGLGGLGLHPDLARSGIPFFRTVAADPSADAAPATPERVAALFRDLRTSLRLANQTLAAMDDEPFGVAVNASQARMDVDGDGTVASNEMLMASLGRVLGIPVPAPDAEDLLLRFDEADAAWLQGYTHFLAGLLDVLTAYDWMPVWNQCAHAVFRNPRPVPPIDQYAGDVVRRERETQFLDYIAALHEMRLELLRPEALRSARDDFRAMVACSRTCWQRVRAETDDDHEWLPSPAQTGPGGARVTEEQIDGWHRVLDELDAVLSGQKLLAHWRLKPGTGINVDKLVASPPRLDLVLLVQGSALLPYVEEGSASDLATWRALMQPFGPGFARFALWSN